VVSVRNGNGECATSYDRIERHFERLVRFRGSLGEVEGEDEWEISAIVDEAVDSGETFFLVRWRGLPPGSDSWVKESDLFADDLLREWRVRHPATKPATKNHKAARPKKRKTRTGEPVVVERVVRHRGAERDTMFQVAAGEDCGPSDYICIREEQVANPEKLVAYLECIARTASSTGSGGVVIRAVSPVFEYKINSFLEMRPSGLSQGVPIDIRAKQSVDPVCQFM
jgi:hypothetical protein